MKPETFKKANSLEKTHAELLEQKKSAQKVIDVALNHSGQHHEVMFRNLDLWVCLRRESLKEMLEDEVFYLDQVIESNRKEFEAL